MMRLNRQQMLLVALAGVAIWALYLTFGSGSDGSPVGAVSGAGPAVVLDDLEIVSMPERVTDPDGFIPQRNLFAYGQPKRVTPPPSPTPKKKPTAPKPTVTPSKTAAQQAQALRPPVQAPPPPPTPPPVNFQFLGYMGPQGDLIGVFIMTTAEGDEIVLAREGETVGEKFRVHRIGYEDVEIGYTEEPFLDERKVLPMGGRS
jgi:hypothetical protein